MKSNVFFEHVLRSAVKGASREAGASLLTASYLSNLRIMSLCFSQPHWVSATLAFSHTGTQPHWLGKTQGLHNLRTKRGRFVYDLHCFQIRNNQRFLSHTGTQPHWHSATLTLRHTRTQPHSHSVTLAISQGRRCSVIVISRKLHDDT